MKFKITGANKETGDDVEITVVAVTTSEAERVAANKGIMVAHIETLNDRPVLEAIALEPEGDAAPVAAKTSGGTATAVAVGAPAGVKAAAGAGTAAAGAGAGQDTPTPPADAIRDPGQAAAHLEPLNPDAHMEYKLLHNQALYLLERTTNKALAEGWEPVGGVTIAVLNNAPNYYQAIIRRLK